MFRAVQGNPFDEVIGRSLQACCYSSSAAIAEGTLVLTQVIGRATDENLTSENWELILDVCDKVSTQENGYAILVTWENKTPWTDDSDSAEQRTQWAP